MTQNMFADQLGYFKSTLIGLYKQKTKLISTREALRFQYLSAMKSQFSNLVGQIMQQGYVDQSVGGVKLIDYLILFIQKNIPMTTMQGQPVVGWSSNPNSPGGPHGAGYLSPIEDIISNPFDPSSSTKTALEIYKASYWDVMNGNGYSNIDNAFIRWDNFYYAGNLRVASWLRGVADPTTGDMSESGKIETFSIPPTKSWLDAFIYGLPLGTSDKQSMYNSYDYVANALQKNYPAGNLSSLLTSMRQVFSDIVEKTSMITKLQESIWKAEADLTNFVNQYKEFSANADVSAMLLELQGESEKADIPPPPPPTPTPQVVARDITPADNSAVVMPDPPPIKSKFPWMIAAAVLGTVIMARKK